MISAIDICISVMVIYFVAVTLYVAVCKLLWPLPKWLKTITMSLWSFIIILWWLSTQYNELAIEPHFWKNAEAFKKNGLPDPQKSDFSATKKILTLDSPGDQMFCRSKLVKYGLCSPISDLQTPIGVHHAVLYFPIQIKEIYIIL